MINAAHVIIYSQHPEQARAFFRDVLGLKSADAGDGWLIFALPPAELAFHPAELSGRHELYLMCDDIDATLEDLKRKGVEITQPVSDEGWGRLAAFRIPGGGELGIYQAQHPSPLNL